MRVLLVPSSYLPVIGGLQINTHNLAKTLKSKGIEISVLTGGKSMFSKPTILDGILIHSLPFYVFRGTVKSFFAFVVRGIICFFKGSVILLRTRPDIVNIHFLGTNAFYLLLLKRVLSFKLVITLHGTNEAPKDDLIKSEGYWEALILNWTAKKVLQEADVIISISKHLHDKVLRFYPSLKRKCIIIPVGIILGDFKSIMSERGDYILALGRLAEEKGFDILLRSFAKIYDSFPELKLIIAGGGTERNSLALLAISLGLSDRVLFCGEVAREKAFELLSKCKLFVIPSRNESFGVVILEAMAFGKAVVATSVGGIPEIIKDGETGFLVPPDDPEELSRVISHLLSDERLAKDVGSRALEVIVGTYNWDAISDKYLTVYRAVLNTCLPDEC
jgi:glycosyltransferase involved in cell wall biosynthesis